MKEMTQNEMIYNLHQVQHILNHLINGGKYNGKELDTNKLVDYKISVVKLLDQIK